MARAADATPSISGRGDFAEYDYLNGSEHIAARLLIALGKIMLDAVRCPEIIEGNNEHQVAGMFDCIPERLGRELADRVRYPGIIISDAPHFIRTVDQNVFIGQLF